MYTGKLIFSQVMDYMPMHTFRRCVARYQGDRNTRSFTCFDQYLCMAFAQLTYRESLRDIEACLRAQQQKLYHMGIRGTVAKSNLADANEQRAWHIYADLAHSLIITARQLYSSEPLGVELQQTVYALDATTIDLCLSMFPWAPFRPNQGGNQTAYASGSKGQHSHIHLHHRWYGPRREDPRCTPNRAGCLLCNGQRISGLCQTPRHISCRRVLCDSFKIQSQMSKNLFTSDRQDNRPPLRSDNHADWLLFAQRLSQQTKTRQVLRCRHQQDSDFPDQQFRSAGTHNCATLPLPMAGGAFLQVDQTKPAHQEFLRHFGECRQNSNLDSCFSICPGRHTQKTSQYTDQSLHNFTNIECLGFRKNPVATATYGNNSGGGNLRSSKPVEFIHLTVGH
jgi:hypothetical protein